MIYKLKDYELDVLKILSINPNGLDFFMLANLANINFDEGKMILNKLISEKYILAIKANKSEDDMFDTHFFIFPEKKEEINMILEQNYKDSIIDIQTIDCINAGMDDKSYVCIDCEIIYKNNINKCKLCNNNIVEIDTKMLDIILNLNRKGYKTANCCSGHISNMASAAYLEINNCKNIQSLPVGFSKEDHGGSSTYRAINYYKRLNKKSTAVLKIEDFDNIRRFIDEDMANLREWANNLPIA